MVSGTGGALPIRTGIVGFGVAGRVFHSSLLAADDAYSIDLIVTSDPDRAAQAATVARSVVPRFEDLMDHAGELDLVVVATPPNLHAGQAAAALEAGLAVVVDKPFTPTADQGRDLVALARERGALLTVFQSRRWDGDFLTVSELVANGSLGQVHRFESNFERWLDSLRVAWHGAVPASAGGGNLFDVGAHAIDQALHLFGPAELAYGAARSVGGFGSDDEAIVLLEHHSGVVSTVTLSRRAAQVGQRFRVLGDLGGYICRGQDGQEAALRAGLSPRDPSYGVTPPECWGVLGRPGAEEQRVPTARGAYPRFYELLAAAIRDGGPVPVDPLESVAVIELIEAVHQAGASL
jgi:predicted dehydrogenase